MTTNSGRVFKFGLMAASCFGLLSCSSSPVSVAIKTVEGQRYEKYRKGKLLVSALPPIGEWYYKDNRVRGVQALNYSGGSQYEWVGYKTRIGFGKTIYHHNEEGLVVDYRLKPAQKKEVVRFENVLTTLNDGDYQRGMEVFYHSFFTHRQIKQKNLAFVKADLVKLHGLTCWKFKTFQAYGPLPSNPYWGNGAAGMTKVYIECPLYIEGTPGELNFTYSSNVWLNQYRQTYGNNAPTSEELFADLEARVKPMIDSLQIHVEVSQPAPNNSEPTGVGYPVKIRVNR